MNYIEAQLLRQRQLWALLTVDPQAESGEETGKTAPVAEEPAAAAEDGGAGETADLAVLLTRRSAENRLRQKAAGASAPAEREGETDARPAAAPAAAAPQLPEMPARFAAEPDPAAEGGAEALSRAFERDARRYDGAYPLY